MTGLSLKLFFRNRIVPLMAVLLAAATVLLSVACCLFYSADRSRTICLQYLWNRTYDTGDHSSAHGIVVPESI